MLSLTTLSIDTHNSYHKGVDIALSNLGTVGVVIATHNEGTVVCSMERVRQMKIDPKDPHVQFAQLYGMADHLTLLLAHNDQRVFKYVPFGPVEYPTCLYHTAMQSLYALTLTTLHSNLWLRQLRNL
jgi:hypothetical protein